MFVPLQDFLLFDILSGNYPKLFARDRYEHSSLFSHNDCDKRIHLHLVAVQYPFYFVADAVENKLVFVPLQAFLFDIL